MEISNGEKYVPIRAERIHESTAIEIICGVRDVRGLYWFIDHDKNIVGIDNSTHDMWVEEFTSIGDCIRWLQREDF